MSLGIAVRNGPAEPVTPWSKEGAFAARSPIRPQSFEFSTGNLPRNEQFEAWRASYASILDLTAPAPVEDGFAAQHQVWDLGSLAFSRVSTNGLAFTGLAGRGRHDPLDHWLFTMLLNGHSTTLAAADRLEGDPGSVQLHPLGRAFEGNISRSEMLMLFVPRDLCRDLAHVLDAAAFSRLEGGMGRIFADYMISLARRLPLLDVSELPELVSATRAMLLACVAPSRERLEEASTSISNMLLERARCYIQANLHDPDLDLKGLLHELGISRSRLYRLFEPTGGVMRYIQHRRLVAAHVALADANDRRRILEIAESCCFSDGAEFSRAFRREFGYSPSEVRAGTHHGAPGWPSLDLDVPTTPTQRLNTLLRRLQG
ncbi:helix-turn-helix domain-containing protein [Aquamicrobium sp. LC103]|uniref:helix-turn-helix domain-containing protein n=1 Tax=Aquamicrobium sp. LC103 TaxID=1120658 RepID=UPI000A719BA3|nr:helix-turn-helix domain-containing protein [Aquamicrobium sp. LC103]TKT69088.1 helix-turn-helix domain-containing protein [Aquamicrobium sp. LC103]